MKYEIIRDKEDLYVLVINNIVVLITREISEITDEIQDDVYNRMINPKRYYEPAIINAKTRPKGVKEIKEDETTTKIDKKPDDGSLGKLFQL